MFASQINAQLNYKLTVVDNHQNPLVGMQVYVNEIDTKEKIQIKTDQNGEISIELKTGKNWLLTVGKMYNYKTLIVPENGYSKIKEFLTYDIENWEIQNRPPPDRSNIKFEYVKQNVFNSTQPTSSQSVVHLIAKRANHKPLSNFPINLTCIKTKTIFVTKTDDQGIARFLVPFNQEYEIDIDGIENFKHLKFLIKEPARERLGFIYEPTDIDELVENDTVTQNLKNLKTGTTARIFYKVIVKDNSGNLLSNENVFLNLIKSNKVYKAKTNTDGQAIFLLPKNNKYLINLDFQRDINVINTKNYQGIGNGEIRITYKPDPKLQNPEKYIPTLETLLVSEFNNFLEKQYQKPEKGKPLRMIIEWGNDFINGKSKEAVLNIGFTADNDESNKYGPPINISFVVDKSGSMAGYERLEELKKSLINFISSLRENDIASLVCFDNEPQLVIESGKIAGRKNYFIDMINMLEANGYTNIYKAMILGYDEVLKNMMPKGTNRVVLLTDGYGETEVGVIVAKSKEYNKKGVQLSAIGVGQDYNQALLMQLASDGSGVFQHIGDAYNLQKSFKNEISSLLYPVAKDVSLEIIYNNKIVFKNLYGFQFSKLENNKVKMKLDNIYPGLNRLAIVKFDLKNASKSIENERITLKLKYFDYNLNKQSEIEEKVYLKWKDSDENIELILENEHKKLYAIAVMNQSLKVMADAFSKDDFEKAEKAVLRAIEQINEIYPQAKDKDVENLFQTLKNYSDILMQYKKNKYRK